MRRRRPNVHTLPAIAAAGIVSLHPASAMGWGVGGARLAPVEWAPSVNLYSRDAAMELATVGRARDLVCTAVGALPVTQWRVWFDGGRKVEEIAPPTWADRPDPDCTRQHLIAWTTDDLFFYGRAYWRITSRLATSFPASFERMPAADVHITNDGRLTWKGHDVPAVDVVEFLSPNDGLLNCGYRTISTAQQLDMAAERFASAEVPAGWLEQTENSEPMSAVELTELADSWTAARRTRTTAALNPFVKWRESTMDPARLQLIEARQHSALELTRLANIPGYLVGAPQGTGMTYLNTAQAKADLLDFGVLPYVLTIEQTLSGPNVTPQGRRIRLETETWLRNPLTPGAPATPDTTPPAVVDQGGRPRQSDGQTGAI